MKKITMEILESLVPDRIFWRGEDLYNEGAVNKIDISDGLITAEVMGTYPYKVQAEYLDDNFLFSCTCPYEGFCKHCIALGLWMVDNKSKLSKLKETQQEQDTAVDAAALLKKATTEQKDKFLLETLNESPVLLKRFEIMLKGPAQVGSDLDIDRLVSEIKTELEKFDLENYERFYDSAPQHFGYREDWEVLQDGAEAEFYEILDVYKNKIMELFEIHNVLGSFKYLLSLYESVKSVDFDNLDDPACIYEGGLYDLADIYLSQLLQDFLGVFSAVSFDETVYRQLIDIFFKRLARTAKDEIYWINDFNGILIKCLANDKIALYMEKLLRKNPDLDEEAYCELMLEIYEKTAEKNKWLNTAEKYYQTNPMAAKKLLEHYVNNKDMLLKLARNVAFQFDKQFIPFLYENLDKEDDPDLYKKILSEHTKEQQSLELYNELRKKYGVDAAMQFINSLENDWKTENFYIRLLKEEKAYEKLLSLAQKNSLSGPAVAYLRPIVNIYPGQVFDIISGHTKNYLAENTGRNYYRVAAEWLKLLTQITDKQVKEKSASFVNQLMEKFKNRPALKDELRRVGLA
jgi:hypothetical protein